MIANYATAAGSSSIITLAIFYAMQSLIVIQPGILAESREMHIVDFIRNKRPEDPPIIEAKPIPRPDLAHLPETPERIDKSEHGPIHVPLMQPQPPRPARQAIGFSLSDGPLINIVRVQPGYPARAQMLALEGFVVVKFDVAENGQTVNAVAVESSHRIFENAALNAAGRLRYKPRVVDGVAIATRGIRYRFTFEMEK